MPIIQGDIVRVNQVIRVDGVSCVTSQDYLLFNEGTASNDVELMTSLLTDNWTTNLINILWANANSTGITAVCVQGKKILPDVEDPFIVLQNVPGNVVGDWLPSQAALMLTKTSKSGGPGSSGRNFWPGPPESHITNGALNTSGVAAWNALASYFNDQVSDGAFAAVWQPVLVRKDLTTPDIFKVWANANIRTIRNRQAVLCPV